MSIKKIKITNFKGFKDEFIFELNEGINILVGNNETGKSTILEAIHVALTGMYRGKSIHTELSQYLFNKTTVDEYLNAIKSGESTEPPRICIEIFFNGSIDPDFEGNQNSDKANKVEGLRFEITYNNKFNDEYSKLVESKNIASIPIEYYEATWTTFARQTITVRSIPIKSAIKYVSFGSSRASSLFILI